MSFRFRTVLTAALVFTLGASAGGEDVKPDHAATMASANNMFAWTLYEQMRADEGNLFLSPYSVHAALAMTREGARGETAREMDRVLFLSGAERGVGYQALLEALTPRQIRELWQARCSIRHPRGRHRQPQVR